MIDANVPQGAVQPPEVSLDDEGAQNLRAFVPEL